jgi:hypothetical protein
MLGNIRFVLVASGLALVASGSASAATTTVYKCFDRNLTVLYSDEPCSGEQMNVKTNVADPAALAELQHERDALARSAAQRLADSRRASLERAAAAPWVYVPEEDFGTYAGGAAYVPYGYAGIPAGRPKRLHAAATRTVKSTLKPRVAPSPPHIIPPR